MIKALSRAALAAAVLLMTGSGWAATPSVSWTVPKGGEEVGTEKNPKNWIQVSFLDEAGKQRVMAFREEWNNRASANNPNFAPALDKDHFNIALPLLDLTPKGFHETGGKKVSVFDSKLSGYWLYVRFEKTTLKDQDLKISVKKDKPADNFVHAPTVKYPRPTQPLIMRFSRKVEGLKAEGSGDEANVRVVVNPPGVITPASGNELLSGYELLVIKTLAKMPNGGKYEYDIALAVCGGKNEANASQAACWRAGVKTALGKVASLTVTETDLSGWELSYIKGRLSDADYALYEKGRKEASDPTLGKALIKLWRDAIRKEADGYVKAGGVEAQAAYNPKLLEEILHPSANKREKTAALAQTPLQKALADLLGASGNRNWVERAVLEFHFKDDQQKILDLAAMPDGPDKIVAITMLRMTAKADAQKYLAGDVAMKGLGDVLKANNLTDDNLLAYYCGETPPPVTPAAAAGSKAVDELKAIAGAGDTEAAGKGFDSVPLSPDDPALKRCQAYWDAKKKEKLASDPSMLRPAAGGNYTNKTRPVDKEIGKDTGQAVDAPEDKNANRDLIAGAKMGVWAATIGGILLGPVGLLMLGAAGAGLGWWMSKEINK